MTPTKKTGFSPQYPTKEAILAEVTKSPLNPMAIEITREWKEKHYTKKWRSQTLAEKQEAIEVLLKTLYRWFKPNTSKKIKILWDNEGWRFNPYLSMIFGQKNQPSIISALHELGHAIYGISETKACAFSVGLFKEVFPREFSLLEWHGHMLKKKITK